MEASPSDQALVLVRGADYTLEQKGVWDTMGMRGTCSPPQKLTATGGCDQIIAQPFAEIASQSMTPISHILWAGVWLGTAMAAVSKARAFVRAQARATPGSVPPTALRLAEVTNDLQLLRTSVLELVRDYEQRIANDVEELSSIGYALKTNNMKISTSRKIVDIVHQSLLICGIMGYKNDSKFAMSRHIADALSAALMVGNDRMLATNAALLRALSKASALLAEPAPV